jgi:anthranilate phosphoribosyltransferase
MQMKQYIEKCLAGEELTIQEAASALELIMTGQATDVQIAGLLIALRAKGETVNEIVGFAETMRSKSVKVHVEDPNAVDIVGTGGDGLGTFNISTVASFVCAGAGVTVAKHGNRSVSSKSGSADVLSALGANMELPPAKVEHCINSVGIGFLFAPLFHPAMKLVARPRVELGVRTVFNMLGPITNPAGVTRQVIGAYQRKVASCLAGALQHFNTDRACVVHSDDGMDEISLSSPTTIFDIQKDVEMTSYSVSASTFGMSQSPMSCMSGGSKEKNAEIALRVLTNEECPARNVVVANAAFGIHVSGKTGSIPYSVEMASESIASGRAMQKLKAFVEFTNRP